MAADTPATTFWRDNHSELGLFGLPVTKECLKIA